jgi:hypothetical protein
MAVTALAGRIQSSHARPSVARESIMNIGRWSAMKPHVIMAQVGVAVADDPDGRRDPAAVLAERG